VSGEGLEGLRPPGEEPTVADMEQTIAEDLLRIHRESYGRGASGARAHLLDDAVVCFLDDLELLPHEQFMIERGYEESVVRMRDQYQMAIEIQFRAVIERATGRKVTSFVSKTKFDPHYAVEIFRLGPSS
jgi:uncharacterized protein YbcI